MMMERRIPTQGELRAVLDARLAEAEQAMREAAAIDGLPGDLHARRAAVLEALIALRREIAAGVE